MNYIITIIGVGLRAILSVLLSIGVDGDNAEFVVNGINFIMIACIVIGVVMAVQRYKGRELVKALVLQALIGIAGFFATKILVWILLILGVVLFLFIGSALEPKSYNNTIMYQGKSVNVRKIDDHTYEDPEGNIYTID